MIRARFAVAASICGIDHDFPALPPAAYSYLLAIYLGDGCISRGGRVWRLRITLDSRYPDIIDRTSEAIEVVVPGHLAGAFPTLRQLHRSLSVLKTLALPVSAARPRQEAFEINSTRTLARTLVNEATEEFVRGLIDIDGSRVVANDRGVRYHFSNRSDDIRALFCAALDRLEVPWTRPRWFEVAVYRKAAVARLDEFVGPKA